VPFIVTALKRQKLGAMSDADAKAEGYESFDAYKALILKMHKGMQWKGDAQVWVHSFKRKG